MGRSIGVRDLRKRRENSRKWHENLRSGENLIRIYEISPDLVKILLDLREISPKSRFCGRDLGFFRRILEFFSSESRFLVGIWGFRQNLGFSLVGSSV